MDGNGRWAKARGLPRVAGHRRGADAVRRVIRGAGELGIPVLTLFGFSSENWKRPADEVSDLMGLLRHYLRREIDELGRNGVRLRVIGDRDAARAGHRARTSPTPSSAPAPTPASTSTSASTMARATRSSRRPAASRARSRPASWRPRGSTRTCSSVELLTAGVPDPDLLIRTSGEQRISNFLLWQCAYAELVFVDTLWPDFGKDHLEQAIAEFRRRDRRYGGVGS